MNKKKKMKTIKYENNIFFIERSIKEQKKILKRILLSPKNMLASILHHNQIETYLILHSKLLNWKNSIWNPLL